MLNLGLRQKHCSSGSLAVFKKLICSMASPSAVVLNLIVPCVELLKQRSIVCSGGMPENKGGTVWAPWLCGDDPNEIRSAHFATFSKILPSWEQTKHNNEENRCINVEGRRERKKIYTWFSRCHHNVNITNHCTRLDFWTLLGTIIIDLPVFYSFLGVFFVVFLPNIYHSS